MFYQFFFKESWFSFFCFFYFLFFSSLDLPIGNLHHHFFLTTLHSHFPLHTLASSTHPFSLFFYPHSTHFCSPLTWASTLTLHHYSITHSTNTPNTRTHSSIIWIIMQLSSSSARNLLCSHSLFSTLSSHLLV